MMKNIKGIIWDLDNTLYRFDAAYEHACNVTAARAARALGLDMDLDKATIIARQSFLEYGFSGYDFVNDHGICLKEYHYSFHDLIDESIIQACAITQQEIAKLDKPHVIITHASKDWARRVLTHLGLKDYFADDTIFAFEDYDFEAKSRSPISFDMAQSKLELPAPDILVVEDNARNLSVPKEMGFQTALVHHGHKPKESYDHIDYEFADTIALLKDLD